MTLFERVFGGNDYNYERTVAAVNEAIAANGEGCAVAFPNTAYSLPCYYGITGVKITTMGEMKNVVDLAAEKGIRDQVKIMVGGAPVTQSFCDSIGADCYTSDAASAADAALALCQK